MRKMLVLVAVLMLGACATGYQAKGMTGGYSDAQIDENTYRVSFQGNGYSSKEDVENMMLYRAAEITDQKGYDWFEVTERDADEAYAKNQRYRLTSTAIIKMYKGKKPENSLRSYDAKSVLKYLSGSVKSSSR
jgi:hypothetical protein